MSKTLKIKHKSVVDFLAKSTIESPIAFHPDRLVISDTRKLGYDFTYPISEIEGYDKAIIEVEEKTNGSNLPILVTWYYNIEKYDDLNYMMLMCSYEVKSNK